MPHLPLKLCHSALHDLTRINSVKVLLALVGSSTAIEPWTLGDLGGFGFASKIYDDLDTDVSIARKPNVQKQKKQVSSLIFINTFIKMIIVRLCPTGRQRT